METGTFEWVKKDWGTEKILVNTELYASKILYLDAGYQCSIHCHKIKDETFYMLEGEAVIEVGNEQILLAKDMSVRVPRGIYHRFKGLSDCRILEVSTKDSPTDSYRKSKSGRWHR